MHDIFSAHFLSPPRNGSYLRKFHPLAPVARLSSRAKRLNPRNSPKYTLLWENVIFVNINHAVSPTTRWKPRGASICSQYKQSDREINIRHPFPVMSVKLSPRPRKHNLNEMKQEIVAQVHKSGKSSSQENIIPEDVIAPSSKTYTKLEDRNENFSLHNTPSREISVDSETQINSKIISLIETEMKRDKHSHFTDSRPQSLSFYEDEKVPEELSGNFRQFYD